MNPELVEVASAIIGIALALAVPVGGAAFFIGNMLAKQSADSRIRELEIEVKQNAAATAQKDRQIGEQNEIITANQSPLRANGQDDVVSNAVTASSAFLSIYGNSVWNAMEAHPPPIERISEMKVVAFVNNKGGVGKTTLSSSFGAYLCERGKRVLFVDMDYQGSLTTTVLSATQTPPHNGVARTDVSDAYSWLDGNCSVDQFVRNQTVVKNTKSSTVRLVESDYNLPSEEDRNLFQWLIGKAQSDLRFRLRALVWSPTIQKSFDVVIIDAPPKLSVGSVNALTASTHFVIPTILDSLSFMPIRLLLSSYDVLFKKLRVSPKLCGVAVMKTRATTLRADEKARIETINGILNEHKTNARVFKTNIPFSVAFAKTAGISFAFDDEGLKPRLSDLFLEIENSMLESAV